MFISSLNYFRQHPIQLFCCWTYLDSILFQSNGKGKGWKVLIIVIIIIINIIIIIIIKSASKMKWFCLSAVAARGLWCGPSFNAMLFFMIFSHQVCIPSLTRIHKYTHSLTYIEVEHVMNPIYNSYSYKLSTYICHIKLLSFKCFVLCFDDVARAHTHTQTHTRKKSTERKREEEEDL